MPIFKYNKKIDADLKGLTLGDLLDYLEDENFFNTSRGFFLSKKIDNNHLIFHTPGTKAAPPEIYEFKYFPQEKKLKVNGKYENLFFPCLITYVFPLVGVFIYFNGERQAVEHFWPILWMFIVITLCCGLVIFSGLRGSEGIERELFIRANYILRKKGYRTGI